MNPLYIVAGVGHPTKQNRCTLSILAKLFYILEKNISRIGAGRHCILLSGLRRFA